MPIVMFPAVRPVSPLSDVRVSISSAAALAVTQGKTVYVALQSLSAGPHGQKKSIVEQHAAKGNKEVQHWIQVYRFRLASDPNPALYSIVVEAGPLPFAALPEMAAYAA